MQRGDGGGVVGAPHGKVDDAAFHAVELYFVTVHVQRVIILHSRKQTQRTFAAAERFRSIRSRARELPPETRSKIRGVLGAHVFQDAIAAQLQHHRLSGRLPLVRLVRAARAHEHHQHSKHETEYFGMIN